MSLLQKVLGKGLWGSKRPSYVDSQMPLCNDPQTDIETAASRLSIPCLEETPEDIARDRYRARGQFLARQERWSDLADEVARADSGNLMTPARMPVAELLCFGARVDVVAAVEHALLDGRPERDAPLLTGIEALENMRAEDPKNLVRAIIVAQAHMDLGWAWRGSVAKTKIPSRNLEAFDTHFARARGILTEFKDNARNSTLYLSSICTLNASGVASSASLTQDYESLIDLDPKSPAPMRSLGTYISPRWYGSHGELELEARRTAARVSRTWGAAGYTWVMFDALPGDPAACAGLDVEFFVEGVEDILERMQNQHTANTLAAYCALTLGGQRFSDPQADATRATISDCADNIVRNHLKQLRPLIWAHAAAGFDNNLRVTSPRHFAASGRKKGLCKIAELFGPEIANGNRIIFTDNGPVAEHV